MQQPEEEGLRTQVGEDSKITFQNSSQAGQEPQERPGGQRHKLLRPDDGRQPISQTRADSEVYSLNPPGLWGIDPTGLGHFLVGD